MNFVAFDVETANADLGSICQLGVVKFADGKVSEVWDTLVNPETYFDPMNQTVHGIGPEAVREAPTLPEVFERLSNSFAGKVVAHHTAFDRASVARASERYGLSHPECRWLDTTRVVRRCWAEFATKGYGLSNLAQHFAIEFRHHNAAEDARTAGLILMRAIEHSGIPVDEWVVRAMSATPGSSKLGVLDIEVNADGILLGEVIVFTGSLAMSRREAAELAAKAGCTPAPNVTKATTLVVVGNQDVSRLAGQEKSNKHRKAEELISQGHAIRILTEDDFGRLVAFR